MDENMPYSIETTDKNEELNNYDYSQLPTEILQHIFSYLTYNEIKIASIVCKQWNHSKYHRKFIKKNYLRITTNNYQLLSNLLSFNFHNLYFTEIKTNEIFNCIKAITSKNTNEIFQLKFYNINIDKHLNIMEIFVILPFLKAIEFKNCSFTKGVFSQAINQKIPNIESYTNDYDEKHKSSSIVMKQDLFNKDEQDREILFLLTVFPKITCLNVCLYNTQHMQKYLTYIDAYASQLKELQINSYVYLDDHGQAIKLFTKNMNNLNKLKKFSCCSYKILKSNSGILWDPKNNIHKTLTYLDVSNQSVVTDKWLLSAIQHLKNLQTLYLRNCFKISSSDTIKELKQLKKLKSLDISLLQMTLDYSLKCGIAEEKNEKFEELYMEGCKVKNDTICQIAKNLTKLKILDLSRIQPGVLDESVQTIINNCRFLRILNLNNSYMLTDYALAGLVPISNLTGLRVLKLRGTKITDFALKHFQFLELNYLDLSECCSITEDGLYALAKTCRSITEVHLKYMAINKHQILNILQQFPLIEEKCIKFHRHRLSDLNRVNYCFDDE